MVCCGQNLITPRLGTTPFGGGTLLVIRLYPGGRHSVGVLLSKSKKAKQKGYEHNCYIHRGLKGSVYTQEKNIKHNGKNH